MHGIAHYPPFPSGGSVRSSVARRVRLPRHCDGNPRDSPVPCV
ncbi:hypothetical protein C791_3007 [Amycolatopsis azurea DSM 43854]|uniref:Uncharacterized protein n=1 Tax=Amycolatopsis azurea DSM 43854 TaxID=1238180 RepID=M2PYE0_9PSEU|nr:hypothetical protein C791_3007 [Amycolatopsis azurea DSM 43854]